MSFRKNKHAGEQDFELNLASIIDCFTVLITYLLVSASFISLGALDVTLTSNAPSTEQPPPQQPLDLAVIVHPDGVMNVKLSGQTNEDVTLPPKDGTYDLDGLSEQLEKFKAKGTIDVVTVAADPTVEYHDVVKAVEAVRKQATGVVFGEVS